MLLCFILLNNEYRTKRTVYWVADQSDSGDYECIFTFETKTPDGLVQEASLSKRIRLAVQGRLTILLQQVAQTGYGREASSPDRIHQLLPQVH